MGKTILLIFTLLAVSANLHAQNWHQIPTGTTKKLNTIDFPSSSIGYIGGNDSLLLKTTDGGRTWQEVSYSGVTFYPGGEHILKLQFLSETTGYMTVGPYSGSYKTTDGGQTWQAVGISSNLCFNEALYFFDENNGFIGGSGCFQGELIDRQSAGTWSAANVSFNSNGSENRVTDIDFYGTSFGLASSAGGRILRTTNGGQTWDSIVSSLGNSNPVHAVKILNDTLCFAAYSSPGTGFGIIFSADAGLTWNSDMQLMTFFYPEFYELHQSGNGKLYAGGRPGWDTTGLIFTYGTDQIWSFEMVDFSINGFSSYADSIVFAAGDYGYLITNVQPSVLEIDTPEATEHTVSVYPNPASGEVAVAFYHLSEHPAYQLFTTSGQLVETGTMNKNRLSVAHLSAGAYVLKIHDGEWFYTSRIVRN